MLYVRMHTYIVCTYTCNTHAHTGVSFMRARLIEVAYTQKCIHTYIHINTCAHRCRFHARPPHRDRNWISHHTDVSSIHAYLMHTYIHIHTYTGVGFMRARLIEIATGSAITLMSVILLVWHKGFMYSMGESSDDDDDDNDATLAGKKGGILTKLMMSCSRCCVVPCGSHQFLFHVDRCVHACVCVCVYVCGIDVASCLVEAINFCFM